MGSVPVSEMTPRSLFDRLTESRITETDRRYVKEVLDAGIKNTEDPADIYNRLESAFATKFGVRFAILHNSGTGTMHLCYPVSRETFRCQFICHT